jgi:hypothetical protein
METITIPLCYSEKINRNNFLIPKEVLVKAIDNEREKIEKGILYILPSYLQDSLPFIPLTSVIGKVESIDIENLKAEISIKPEYNLPDMVELGFAYLVSSMENKDGYNLIHDATITYCVLLPKEKSAYK